MSIPEEFTGTLREIVEEIVKGAESEPTPTEKRPRKIRAKEAAPRAPYNCAICGQIGHNKRRCPARNV